MALPPPARLRFLYVGSSDVERDLALHRDGLGATVLWDVLAFGARVAALDVGPGPRLLLADHRPAGTFLPVYEAADLDAAVEALRAAGQPPEGEPFEIPNGPCRLFRGGTSGPFALFQDVRPDAMQDHQT